MLTITFTMLGDVALARAVSRYGDSVKDFRPVWEKIRENFHHIEDEQFNSEGARSGMPWLPLSLSYAAWKEKNYPGQTLLTLTGWMRDQFVSGVGMQTTIDPLKLKMEPNVFYAVIHQQGSPMTNLPPRKVVALTEDDKAGWMKMVHNYIYDKAKEAHLA